MNCEDWRNNSAHVWKYIFSNNINIFFTFKLPILGGGKGKGNVAPVFKQAPHHEDVSCA